MLPRTAASRLEMLGRRVVSTSRREIRHQLLQRTKYGQARPTILSNAQVGKFVGRPALLAHDEPIIDRVRPPAPMGANKSFGRCFDRGNVQRLQSGQITPGNWNKMRTMTAHPGCGLYEPCARIEIVGRRIDVDNSCLCADTLYRQPGAEQT